MLSATTPRLPRMRWPGAGRRCQRNRAMALGVVLGGRIQVTLVQGQPAEATQRLAHPLGVPGALGKVERLGVQWPARSGSRRGCAPPSRGRRGSWRPGHRRRAPARSPGSPAGRPAARRWSACTDAELSCSVQRDGAQPLVRGRAPRRPAPRRARCGRRQPGRAPPRTGPAHPPAAAPAPDPAGGCGPAARGSIPGRPGSCPGRLPAGPARRPGPARPGPPASAKSSSQPR